MEVVAHIYLKGNKRSNGVGTLDPRNEDHLQWQMYPLYDTSQEEDELSSWLQLFFLFQKNRFFLSVSLRRKRKKNLTLIQPELIQWSYIWFFVLHEKRCGDQEICFLLFLQRKALCQSKALLLPFSSRKWMKFHVNSTPIHPWELHSIFSSRKRTARINTTDFFQYLHKLGMEIYLNLSLIDPWELYYSIQRWIVHVKRKNNGFQSLGRWDFQVG